MAAGSSGSGIVPPGPEDSEDELAQLKAKLRRQYERTDQWVKMVLLRPEHPELGAPLPYTNSSPPKDKANSKAAEDRIRRRQSPTRRRRGRKQQLQQAQELDRLIEANATTTINAETGESTVTLPGVGMGHRAMELHRARDMAAFMLDKVDDRPEGSWLRRHRSGKFIQELPRFLTLHPKELQDITSALTGKYRITKELGRGGSGTVYAADVLVPDSLTGLLVGDQVAVKTLIHRGTPEEPYLREGLIDVAFFSVLHALHEARICPTLAIFDIVYSARPFPGLSDPPHAASQPTLSVVMQRADGTKGRFATPEDEEYDPFDDTMLLQPFDDFEVFQLLYIQLTSLACLECKIFDLMLRGQLRGDNLGFRLLGPTEEPGVTFQVEGREDVVLFFPTPCRVLYLLDLGQGRQPNVEALHRKGLIGNPMVATSMEDDGFGRYWPPDELYTAAKPVTALGQEALQWAASLKVGSPQAAAAALQQLHPLFLASYGVPTADRRIAHSTVWGCDPGRLSRARALNPLTKFT